MGVVEVWETQTTKDANVTILGLFVIDFMKWVVIVESGGG